MTNLASPTEHSTHAVVDDVAREVAAVVRVVRMLGLILAVVAMVLAQLLLRHEAYDSGGRLDALPVWLANVLAVLGVPVYEWMARPVSTAVWLLAGGLVLAALVSPWWRGERGRQFTPLAARVAHRNAWVNGLWAVTVLGGATAAVTGALGIGAPWVWLPAVAALLAAGAIHDRVQPGVRYAESYRDHVQPLYGWPYLLALLALFGWLYSIGMPTWPARVDEGSASLGLIARAWTDGETAAWLAMGSDAIGVGETAPAAGRLLSLPVVAGLLLAVPDGVMALRLAGLVSMLLVLAGVWLVGTELFRRAPVYGVIDEVVEDDGRWIALLAVVATGVLAPSFYLSRQPGVLDVAVLGLLALWAFLRGLRLDRLGLLVVSGLATGVALLMGAAGLWLVGVMAMLWLGIYLLAREWIVGRALTVPHKSRPITVQRGAGRAGMAMWATGVAVAASPLVGLWVNQPSRFWALWHWGSEGAGAAVWRVQLQTALLGLMHLSDRAGVVPNSGPLLSTLAATLLLLALGALVLSVDSLPGWVLVSWLGVGVLWCALAVPVLPDWSAYALLIPAMGLALAFGLDRLRVLLMQSLGTWMLQATVYLALGVLLLVGFFGWIDAYNHARRDADLPSTVGHAVAARGVDSVVLVSGHGDMEAVKRSAAVRFIVGPHADALRLVAAEAVEALPEATTFLFAPSDWPAVRELLQAHPGAVLTSVRDLRSNPLLYVLEMPPASP